MIRSLFPLTLVLLAAACSAGGGEDAPVVPENAAALPVVPVGSGGGVQPTPEPLATTPPEAPPALRPMKIGDLEDRRMLGSGCAFAASGDADPILVVRDEGDAMIHAKRWTRLSAATPGREAIAAGETFAGDGLAVTVEHAPGEGRQASDSSVAWPATLLVRTTQGAESRYTGRWECGS